MEYISRLQNEYTKSQRKQVTFKKIYQNRSLSWAQLDRLKTAEAIFECVPMTIYTPFAVFFMRQVARATTPRLIGRTVGMLGVMVPVIEYTAQMTKDKYYWPIVREIYLDLKKNEQKRTEIFADFSKVKAGLEAIANPE